MENVRWLLFKWRNSIARPILKYVNQTVWKIIEILEIEYDEDFNWISEILNNSKWKKVAIVWNSPIIEDSNYWKTIDSYDIVIRLNKWILNKFLNKDNTWVKTDIWATVALDTTLSPNILLQNTITKRKLDIIIPYDTKEMKLKYLILKFLYKNNKLNIPKSIIKEAYNIVNWATPSTWFMIIYLFLKYSECSDIWLFWFSFSDFNRINWCRSHTKSHNFAKEEEVVNKLLQENSDRLKLFK